MEVHTRRLDVEYQGLPEALNGLRIAQVSDAHVGWAVSTADLEQALERVDAEKPDLFVITGDVVDDRSAISRTIGALSAVRSKYGTFACLGNHEYYAGVRAIRHAYAHTSIALLEDEATTVSLPGARIEVSGVTYPLGKNGAMTSGDRFPVLARRALYERATGGDFRLHLAHHPHAFDAAAEHGADLVLSGHTHGGQVGIGSRSAFSPFYRYCRGTYARGRSRLFVHSGTGHWLPVRLGCPAEIAVITLRSAGLQLAAP